MLDEPDLLEHMNFALEADDLSYSGNVRVHHLLDMFMEEVGPKEIGTRVTGPLTGLKVAPYYGCQMTRPRKKGETLEDVEGPTTFEDLLTAIGAEPVHFPYRMRCCGASLIATSRQAALSMLRDLLQDAVAAGADVIATSCPLCQINLEVYQAEVNRELDTDFSMPVIYFTQLMGVALGVEPKALGIGKELIKVAPILECRRQQAEV